MGNDEPKLVDGPVEKLAPVRQDKVLPGPAWPSSGRQPTPPTGCPTSC